MCSHGLEKVIDSRILYLIEVCKFLALSTSKQKQWVEIDDYAPPCKIPFNILLEIFYIVFTDNPLFEEHRVFLVDDIRVGCNRS